MLEKIGCLVISSPSISTLANGGTELDRPLDLMISEVKFPIARHIDLLRELPGCSQSTPIILLTTNPPAFDTIELAQLGVLGTLAKPIGFDQLKATLSSAFEFPPHEGQSDL